LLVREVVRRENLPVEMHIVSDGQEAIDYFAEVATNPEARCPDLLLLDINLPKADGFEVLRRVRACERCKGMPVVVVSSSDSPNDRSEAARLGAVYFRKPPSYGEFLKLGEVLRGLLGI
jgi:DNA-binding response OmpR family regulator